MKIFLNNGILLFAIIGMIYVLIAYPVINNIYPNPDQKSSSHEHKCPCGCQGDMNKCGCHKTSGIVGFRFCDTPAQSSITILSQWHSGSSPLDGELIRDNLEILHPSVFQFPKLDDIAQEIKHPPRFLSLLKSYHSDVANEKMSNT